jgi:hypothetical protein
MSGSTDWSKCPNCGDDMTTYQDWKPVNITENWCLHCGWYSTTKFGQMGLEELNERREEEGEEYDEETDEYKNLETLTELPKCIIDPYEAVNERYKNE